MKESPAPPKRLPAAKSNPSARRQRLFIPRNAAEWSYTYLIGAAAGIVFLARFLTDGPIAGLCFLVPAVCGYYFRWTKFPMLSIVVLVYFLFAPGLFPTLDSNTLRIRLGHFDPMNMILAMAAVVYLVAQYRLYAMNVRAMPNDHPDANKKDPDRHLRQIDAVPDGEWIRLFVSIAVCVVTAEFAWLGITEFYVEPSLPTPIHLAKPPGVSEVQYPGSVPAFVSRLLLLALGIVAFVVTTKFAFWYWRLRRMNPEEGIATIIDLGWAVNRREHRQFERWREKAQRSQKRESS